MSDVVSVPAVFVKQLGHQPRGQQLGVSEWRSLFCLDVGEHGKYPGPWFVAPTSKGKESVSHVAGDLSICLAYRGIKHHIDIAEHWC